MMVNRTSVACGQTLSPICNSHNHCGMTVDNSEFDNIWLEIKGEFANAAELIASEERIEVENEIYECVVELQQSASWLDRLIIGTTAQLRINKTWHIGNIQHVCDQAIVMVTDFAIIIAAPHAVTLATNLSTKIQTRSHSTYRCWHSVLNQVHDIKVACNDEIVSGSITLANKDAIDIKVENEISTIPWVQVSYLEIAL